MSVCLPPPPTQSGDFLTVDRCKIQGGRYQDDSITDTTIGVCFWNNIAFSFFFSFFFLLNTLEHPFLTFFFSNPLPSPLECPFAPMGLGCFSGKKKRGEGSMQGQANETAQSSIMDQQSRQGSFMLDKSWLMRMERGAFVFVFVLALSGRSNLVHLAPATPLSGSAHQSTNWVQTEYLSCRSSVSPATC